LTGTATELLGKGHDRRTFSCGNAALDRYLREQAGQDSRKNAARTYVLSDDGTLVRGFYTLSAASVALSSVPDAATKKLARYPDVPALLIGRLAVSELEQGKGTGRMLLMDALYRCLNASVELGASLVVVDSKDERAASFYEHYGFVRLADDPDRLVLPMATVAEMFS
jgi:predicted GNAT family N-acyltransferase